MVNMVHVWQTCSQTALKPQLRECLYSRVPGRVLAELALAHLRSHASGKF